MGCIMSDVNFFKIIYVHKWSTPRYCLCKKIYYDLLQFALVSYDVFSV